MRSDERSRDRDSKGESAPSDGFDGDVRSYKQICARARSVAPTACHCELTFEASDERRKAAMSRKRASTS